MKNYSMLCDAYEFAMSDAYLQNHKENVTAVFDVFFRKVPSDGGYAVMAGLDKVISYINDLHFSEEDLAYFKASGYSDAFIDYLKDFHFEGDIFAVPDGTPIFPNEPILTVKAPVIQAQILETAILSILNGAIEHATGARRIIEAVPENIGVMEFGARRADGMDAANDASYYALMAGCIGTSNVMTAQRIGIKALGTMAHSFVETFDNEYEAFIAFAKSYPNNCTLLVDTFDTLRSGVPNAIKTFRYMQEHGLPVDHIGIRIDSGDLAYLSKESRKMMDEAGFPQAKICLSNGLKAETIGSLILQGAKFDSLGVGDNISKPEGRLGAVYKEVATIDEKGEIPKIKLSNDPIKIVNPAYKKLYRLFDKNSGYALADIMCQHDEIIPADRVDAVSLKDFKSTVSLQNYEIVELQKEIFVNGVQVYNDPDLKEKQEYCKKQMDKIYPEVKRVLNPHEYYVDGTRRYAAMKESLIKANRG